MDSVTFTGDYLRKSPQLDLEIYDPAPSLVEAVNLAILLKQPLLLMGEPGSGKTRLAESVAAELHKEKYNDYYFRWDIKSTSKAKEGIYQYDALQRMYDATAKNAEAKEIGNYIKPGKFADALTKPQNGLVPNVLLIDEIDKADIDFPNDLLLEIEKGEFYIPEQKKKVKKSSELIIFITSNRERELPPAFLRRCLYHYIKFPAYEDLVRILTTKFEGPGNEKLAGNAVNMFLDIRTKIETQFTETEKKPSTSELLEWFKVINTHYKNRQKLPDDLKKSLDTIEKYEKGMVENGLVAIPFHQALLKTWDSNVLFKTI